MEVNGKKYKSSSTVACALEIFNKEILPQYSVSQTLEKLSKIKNNITNPTEHRALILIETVVNQGEKICNGKAITVTEEELLAPFQIHRFVKDVLRDLSK